MPRSGGPSTTTGVSYQALAIAHRAIDVYLGRCTWVRPEAPPFAAFGDGALAPVAVDDFVVLTDGRKAFYQAKSNAPNGGNWTVNKLCGESILQDFIFQAKSEPAATCHLLTPNPCQLLGSIADSARSSKTLEEFKKNLSQDDSNTFEDFCNHDKVKITEVEGFELLKRFWLEQRSLDALAEDLERLADATFVDAIGASESLFALATGWMRTSEEVTDALLSREFARRAVYRKPAASAAEIRDAIRAATARLEDASIDIKGKVHILQPAVGQVLSWASGTPTVEKPIAAFLDQAGSGKSVAMSVLCRRLRKAGFEVLGIRLDGIAFTTADELQRVLALPAPIPAAVQFLKRQGSKVAVLIDQLDALAVGYANQPQAASTIMDLAARLARINDVPVVVACRAFDWNYSHLLADLRDRAAVKAALPELTAEQVRGVLPAFNIHPSHLHRDTLEVIRSPYRLRLLVEIVEEHRKNDPNWDPPVNKTASLQSLLEEFWSLKMARAEQEAGLSAACTTVVSSIAQYLSANQTLTAPIAILDSNRRAADWLRSAGIIVVSSSNVGFFHQIFFDFIFSRHFVLSHPSISAFLLGTDQGLFYRPLLRQLLTHMRGADSTRYLREVKDLLSTAGIREHLRWLVVATLGQSPEPTRDEYNLLLDGDFLSDENILRTVRFWSKNPGWFDLLGEKTFEAWLDPAKPNQLDAAFAYLESIMAARQERIAPLLEKKIAAAST